MSKKRRCKHCGRYFLITRNPKQHYCSDFACQRARKTHWRNDKRRNDPDYKSNQKRANRRWQAGHPDYWKQYRASHPEYVCRNREKQRVRDRAAIRSATHLAKSDALKGKTIISPGSYWLTPLYDNNLAKSDALHVKIDVITRGYPTMSESCKETTL